MFKPELIKNKIYAVIFAGIGMIPILIVNDVTVFVFTLIFAVPLFCAREDWMGVR